MTPSTPSIRYNGTAILLFAMLLLAAQIGTPLSLAEQWQLTASKLFHGLNPDSFDGLLFVESQLPRLMIAVMVGATLGLVGSLMQQITQNHLVSPLTLGTSTGAWLALVILNVWFPHWVGDFASIAAMSGACLTLGLVLLITGMRNLSGLAIVMAGMAVNILFGAIATAIILLNQEYASNLFIWGAGDLAQNGWGGVAWLAPRLALAVLILLLAPRILTLLKLGHSGARARGLNIVPALVALFALGLWLIASSITTVGVISFVGLLAPNMARRMGATSARDELYFSMLLGALLLVITDALAMLMSLQTMDMIPSGTVTALVGAPALIWFTQRQRQADGAISLQLPKSRFRFNRRLAGLLIIAFIISVLTSIFVTRSLEGEQLVWAISLPEAYSWSIRWPRLITAIAAGSGLAVAGVLLQRLIYNPLASPDILGISAGATFALVSGSLFFGMNIFQATTGIAFLGSMTILVILILLGRRCQFAPATLVLCGIALSALIEALVHFALIKGNEMSYSILSWLAGSTYRVKPEAAISLALIVTLLVAFALATSRWLTLISGGRQFAKARGLAVNRSFVILLTCVGLICAAVTATMGPVAFVGLLAPHMAVMLGANRAKPQLLTAALMGALLLVLADWLGQTLVYPSQIAAGTLVAIVGGSYFILLMIQGRKQR
ncbi:iron complex transport system permease protein [Sinobacterium caligoides]|uniref:Iron complex transport system permease protein n=1 Tax=Sinobacterium caligoides TaxID=933926 RepID=A0A3N2DK20_9GAMM|nr:Fe(3+)-hydroxamate ABC transporter permease FhuB [Sinobacterium caligoides]ROS00151.1 iron complex transport system permease protein [Sinobacterium caligoides]